MPTSLQVDDATTHLLRSTDGSLRKQVTGRGYVGTFTHTFATRLMALAKVITTLISCDDTTMNVELRYLTALEQSTHYKVEGTTLSLFDKEGATPRATFEAMQ
ncbi:META domain-containing protein [Hymenobacter sp. GOD-10R]|uniref:META domain-containing protein n=1 Tax=Hymenobacter sp. GOD-10R TaxID=3093922 RepID=UPI002D7A09EB|nr:META domain-containing protein [Hymenobacter sp. GOD-10R]WRQ29200.1 META domain-containing protein [Hymenobacter sp. GOD-10R]